MSQTVWYTMLDSPWGPLCLAATAQGLVRVDFQHGTRPGRRQPTRGVHLGKLYPTRLASARRRGSQIGIGDSAMTNSMLSAAPHRVKQNIPA
jgi:hypothetical protein